MIELRWLTSGDGRFPNSFVRTLQYRAVQDMRVVQVQQHEGTFVKWSEWKDVPEVSKRQARLDELDGK